MSLQWHKSLNNRWRRQRGSNLNYSILLLYSIRHGWKIVNWLGCASQIDQTPMSGETCLIKITWHFLKHGVTSLMENVLHLPLTKFAQQHGWPPHSNTAVCIPAQTPQEGLGDWTLPAAAGLAAMCHWWYCSRCHVPTTTTCSPCQWLVCSDPGSDQMVHRYTCTNIQTNTIHTCMYTHTHTHTHTHTYMPLSQ